MMNSIEKRDTLCIDLLFMLLDGKYLHCMYISSTGIRAIHCSNMSHQRYYNMLLAHVDVCH